MTRLRCDPPQGSGVSVFIKTRSITIVLSEKPMNHSLSLHGGYVGGNRSLVVVFKLFCVDKVQFLHTRCLREVQGRRVAGKRLTQFEVFHVLPKSPLLGDIGSLSRSSVGQPAFPVQPGTRIWPGVSGEPLGEAAPSPPQVLRPGWRGTAGVPAPPTGDSASLPGRSWCAWRAVATQLS